MAFPYIEKSIMSSIVDRSLCANQLVLRKILVFLLTSTWYERLRKTDTTHKPLTSNHKPDSKKKTNSEVPF